MTCPITIHILEKYKSLTPFEWTDVPAFAVITGVNGAGKSQLLEVLGLHFGALQWPGPVPGSLPTYVEVQGDRIARGEVLHVAEQWNPLATTKASEEAVKERIRKLHTAARNAVYSPNEGVLLDRLGIPRDKMSSLSIEDFTAYLTPGVIVEHGTADHRKQFALLFLAYRFLQREAIVYEGASRDEVIHRYGRPPWEVVNDVLATCGLPLQVVEPPELPKRSTFSQTQYSLALRDVERDVVIPPEALSSGEKVIISTAMWLYEAQQHGIRRRLLLLDEPDSHLHPSYTRQFLTTILEAFVRTMEMRVIMTTHSPSTVALTPAESLFEMRRTAPRLQRVSKDEAVAVLTDGFVVVQEATRSVVVEGKSDPVFYEIVWQLLTKRATSGEQSPLRPIPGLVFVTRDEGKRTVEELVPLLRKLGMNQWYGIIDGDAGNQPSPSVHVLPRYAIENYIFDPINYWAALHRKDGAPDVGVQVRKGETGSIRFLKEWELQRIADAVVGCVEKHIPDLNDAERHKETVVFVGGKSVQYPRWILRRSKAIIKSAFHEAFKKNKRPHESDLLDTYASLNLVPVDLLKILQGIQQQADAGSTND